MSQSKFKNLKDAQQKAYRDDPNNPDLTSQSVLDKVAHGKLDQIRDNLGGTSPTLTSIINLELVTPDTEVAQSLPPNVKGFSIYNRNKSKLQLAFAVNETNTNFITIPPGKTYYNENFYTNLTIYLRCHKGSQIIEIETHI